VNWPRFSLLNDPTLKRFRFQAIFIAIVWGIVAGIRTTAADQSAGAVALTTFLWIVCAGFLVTSVMAFVEVRRRNG
jgi:glucan phosphoethanolaminetransferase (alkaline phosphatase superfamily)